MKVKGLLPNDPVWIFCSDEDIVPIFEALSEKLPIFIDSSGNLSFDHAYAVRSAEKTVVAHWSKLFTKFGNEWTEGEAHTAITANVFFDKLSDTLIAVYGEGWQRLHDALQLEYNPIENYSMIESGHDEHNSARHTAGSSQSENKTSDSSQSDRDLTSKETAERSESNNSQNARASNTKDLLKNKSISDVNGSAENLSEENKSGNSQTDNETTGSSFGFNSNLAVPTDLSKGISGTIDSTKTENKQVDSNETHTVSESNSENSQNVEENTSIEGSVKESSGSENVSHESFGDRRLSKGTNDRIENRDESESNQTDHSFRRTGNIGVTTSQQMLESEFELRKKTFMMKVFKDLDDFLTLAVYD